MLHKFPGNDRYPSGDLFWNHQCTAGFVFINPATGVRALSTAGHCDLELSMRYWQQNVYIGSVFASAKQDTNADYALIDIEQDDQWKSNGIVWKPHNEQWPITHYALPHEEWLGKPVCHTGQGRKRAVPSEPETCGHITELYADANNGRHHLGAANIPSCSQDSGAPVEYDHVAFGLVAMVVPQIVINGIDCGNDMRFSWAHYVTENTGWFVSGQS